MLRRPPPARHVIVVGSGKGGVGKSTIALNLALALKEHAPTGALDADLYGPNIPLMVGLTRQSWTQMWTLARNRPPAEQPLLEPIERYGLPIMSAGFILGGRCAARDRATPHREARGTALDSRGDGARRCGTCRRT